jgi:hypothetical protein
MLARLATSAGAASSRHRRMVLILVSFVVATAVLFFPSMPAQAAPDRNQCTYKEWVTPGNTQYCINQLKVPSQFLNDCEGVPTPDAPDSGFGGWFASDPHVKGVSGYYSTYGYSGYTYPIYTGCSSATSVASSSLPSDTSATTTIANGELMVATGIIGAADAFRERAYDPNTMWGWSNNLVKTATQAIYEKVFSVFGVITIAVVGVYLVWRSRQANMSDALTTAGWAVLVMVVVTAVASWPLISAHLADNTLISALSVVHSAIGPQPKNVPVSECPYAQKPPPFGFPYNPELCQDNRSAAVRASDDATETVLYNNWLRGTLGSATSLTAKKYGAALYESSSLSWNEAETIEKHPERRDAIYAQKAKDFNKVAYRISQTDPSAYSYLQGKEGTARIGAGLIAILSALAFAFFDIAASILVIVGFLIFRWAVVATPILGTVAILRPASAGFKRLINIVVAAIFNIVIFGAGGAIYLFAVDTIMNTASLPGWLQILLVWLCGIVGWLMLRPYRRITQLGGKSPMVEVVNVGSWHRRFFADLRSIATSAGTAAVIGEADDDKVTTGKKGRVEVADQPASAATGDTVTDGPTADSSSRRRRGADQPAPSGATASPEPEPATGRRARTEERIWDPATDRNVGANDYDDLVDMVNESEARISSSADAVDSELAADREWSRR